VIVEPSDQPASNQPPSTPPPAAAPLATDEAPPFPEPVHETTFEPQAPPAVQEQVSEPIHVPMPEPVHAPPPAPVIITKENPVNEELYAKYNMALAEIDQLKTQITTLSTPAAQELRRRTRKLSDADSAAGSDVLTMVEDSPLHQEGVPLQVVVIIALGVFITTYLFF